jgi:hypothetical protein
MCARTRPDLIVKKKDRKARKPWITRGKKKQKKR